MRSNTIRGSYDQEGLPLHSLQLPEGCNDSIVQTLESLSRKDATSLPLGPLHLSKVCNESTVETVLAVCGKVKLTFEEMAITEAAIVASSCKYLQLFNSEGMTIDASASVARAPLHIYFDRPASMIVGVL